jgi:hypothetical protein
VTNFLTVCNVFATLIKRWLIVKIGKELTLTCTNRAKCFSLFLYQFVQMGLCPVPHSLFAKREAKTLRILRILIQSAETTVSAGGAGAEPPQIFYSAH